MAIPLATAALGALAGSQQQSSTQSVNVAPPSALENQMSASLGSNFNSMQGLVDRGPGQQDVDAGLQSSRGLANMLQQFAQGGYMPNAQDNQQAQQFAASQFQPQQVGLQQQFQGQQQRAAQLASQLGRPVNDPIIQAKLSQEYMQGQERLGASQGAFATNFAMQMPQQRLGYTQQLAEVNNSLASQAMANRQALLSLGSQIKGQEQQFRLGTASRTQTGGGGMAGAISGGLGGFGAGMGIANMFGGGGAQAAATGDMGGGTGYLGVNTDLGGGGMQAANKLGSTNYFGQLGAGVAGAASRFMPTQQASAPSYNMQTSAPSYNMPTFSTDLFNPTNMVGVAPYNPTRQTAPMQSGMVNLIRANEARSGRLSSLWGN
jgi:hypothetical protein